MKAVIFAAGVGKRLQGVTQGRPKCLVDLGGRTLLSRHVEVLGQLGVCQVVVVVGYAQDHIRKAMAADPFVQEVRWVVNEQFTRGSITSLWAARSEMDDDVVLMDADVLYAPSILARLVRSPFPTALLMDETVKQESEECMIAAKAGRVLTLSKTLTIAEGGLWGSLTGVSVSVVAVFVIFGAVLNAGEAGQGFMNLAVALAGRQRGGAAKVSVLASAFFGSISGSASANVASTGAITLPTMRKLGYPPAFAGAVEAVASSGGQIMPPLMGAGAFVMVELLGIPYVAIIQAALLPAILYFIAVWLGVNAFATRYDLRPLAAQDRVSSREVLITGMFFALPFTILLERMFNGGYTPQFAAALAIIAGFLLLLFGVKLDFSLARFGQRLLNLTHSAGAQIATIAAIILCASIVIGVLGQTGLGVKITSAILAWSGDQLWIALLLTALACLILGMEVPTTAAYVICVSVAGPALQKLGLAPLQAHLFVFWFALLSTITPPVCGAVFIAAGMVEENWLKVANKAMALGIGLYLIPLAFIANPSLIELAQQPLWALAAAIKIGLALWGISFAIITRGQPLLRLGIGALSLCLMFFLGI